MKQIIEVLKENWREDKIGTIRDFAIVITLSVASYYLILIASVLDGY